MSLRPPTKAQPPSGPGSPAASAPMPRTLDAQFAAVYAELRALADRFLRSERPDHTLQPTALVHEAYLRLTSQHAVDWSNRAQFFGVAAQMMRRVLVDHARAQHAAKRGGDVHPVTLSHADRAGASDPDDNALEVLDLHDALEKLASLDADQARVVELRYFGGLSIEETAEAMGISPATVKREWSVARAWLRRELSGR